MLTGDGVNDRLFFPNIDGMESASTIFVVYKSRQSESAIQFGHIFSVNGDDRHPFLLVKPDTTVALGYMTQAVVGGTVNETPVVFRAVFDGATGKGFLNGFHITSENNTLIDSTDVSAIFGATDAKSFKGDIGELLIYDRVLSNAEILSVENFLGNKWQIDVNSLDTASIFSNLRQWVDVDDESTIVRMPVSMNEQVSLLKDKSGLSDDFISSLSAEQPFWLQADQNGLDVLLFDGIADVMSTAGNVSVASDDFTLFIVSKAVVKTDDRVWYWFNGTGQGFYQNNNDIGSAFFTTPTLLLSQTTPAEFYIAEIIKNGTTGTLFINGVQQNTGTVNATAPDSKIFLGNDFLSAHAGNMKFGESALFDGVITGTARNTIRNNLTKKWGIV